jgi:2-keto-4-pentenoate hydratase/2-oxohepta-3-ene-1,7-dioic acid hydratase in catechol pathway
MEHGGTTTKGKSADTFGPVGPWLGDLISTGTPAGVGHGARPPRYLRPGDVVEMGIDRLGVQRHVVTEWSPRGRRRAR